MPIDSSIPFQALNTPVPLMSMQQHQQNALARQMSQLQMQEQQGQMQDQMQKREQQNALSRAMQTARRPDGTLDYGKASAAPGIAPNDAIRFDEDARAYQEKQQEKQRKGLEKVREALAYANTPERWEQTVTSMAQEFPEMAQYRGKFTPEFRRSLIAQYAPELLKPVYKQVDIGGRIEFVDINPETNPSIAGQSFTKTMTPAQGGRVMSQQPQIITVPTQTATAPVAGQVTPPTGTQPKPLRLGPPPKGVKLPVGMAWDVDNKMAVPLPGVAPKPVVASKPMPPAALKQLNEARENVSLAGGIDDSLAKYSDLIQTGQLNLGVLNNAVAWVRNNTNNSSQESRNLAGLKSTLEKLRNDSLKLNKGVQTEGDAQRAWKELVDNLNDKDVVIDQLNRIRALNKRALQLHQGSIQEINANYGRGQPATAAPATAAGEWKIERVQ